MSHACASNSMGWVCIFWISVWMRWNPITKRWLGFKEKNFQKERNRQFVISPMCTHQVGYRICAERPHNSGPFHLEKQGMRRARMRSFLVANMFQLPDRIFAWYFGSKWSLCFGFWTLNCVSKHDFWDQHFGLPDPEFWRWLFSLLDCFLQLLYTNVAARFFLRPVSLRFTECLFQLTMTRQMVFIVFDSQCSPVSMNRDILKDPNYLVQNKRNQRNPLGSVV